MNTEILPATPEYQGPGTELVQRIDPGAVEQITRAETDIQISTARQYPRPLDRFLANSRKWATLNKEVAASCFYSKPQGKDPKTGKQMFVEGPSINFANILASTFGNIMVMCRITSEKERSITVQALAWDLESNNRCGLEVQRPIWGKYGRFSDDMIKTTAMAAISIARRNAILAVVPKPLWIEAYRAARDTAADRSKPFEQRVKGALDWAYSVGAKPAEIWETLEIGGPTEITEDHLDKITGFRSAIKEGEATVDDIFRSNRVPEVTVVVAGSPGSKTADLTANLKGKAEKAKTTREPGEEG